MKTLKHCESPRPDKVTNEMLKHLGPRTKKVLLYTSSWKTGHIPQAWREANMIPIHKKEKTKTMQNAIDLTA